MDSLIAVSSSLGYKIYKSAEKSISGRVYVKVCDKNNMIIDEGWIDVISKWLYDLKFV